MNPVVRVSEMQAIDAAAPEPVAELIDRAARALVRAAVDLLGGVYGRRVVVVAGKGNNGNDGRRAAELLEARGVRTTVIDAAYAPAVLPDADLVIDAAYGTGLTGAYTAPDPGGAIVVAADIPSGVNGDTGIALGRPMSADVTVTFAAHKPGLLLADGPGLCGTVIVADIGLDVSRATVHVMDDDGAAVRLPHRAVDAHKWRQAVLVVAGSPGMTGAAHMAAAAAQRSGAGMVRIAAPGVTGSVGPVEAVSVEVDETAWAEQLLEDDDRFQAAVVGPGLGTSMVARHQMRQLISKLSIPVVVDGDGLTALGHEAAQVIGARTAATVLTPHDGEFERLTGARPGDDRIGPAQELAVHAGAVVLLKGPTTVVAAPDGEVVLVPAGDQRLATAGTGDVLSGIVVALLAGGVAPLDASAVGAHLHGVAAAFCPRTGTIATDVVDAIPDAFARVRSGA